MERSKEIICLDIEQLAEAKYANSWWQNNFDLNKISARFKI